MKRNFIILAAISGLLFAGAVAATAGDDLAKAETLFQLINERLSYMKDVAAFKWVNKKPIEDKAREEVVIQKTAEAAGKEGLDVESAKGFFRVQIEAAKVIQNQFHDTWKKNGFPRDAKFADLKTEIRPALIDLGNRILAQIKAALPVLKNPENTVALEEMIQKEVTVKYVDAEMKQALLDALRKIDRADG